MLKNVYVFFMYTLGAAEHTK